MLFLSHVCRRAVLPLATIVVLGLSQAATGADAKPAAPASVLFIGNSYTYVNDLPALVKAMAEAKGHKLETDQVTPGGVTLEQHVQRGAALEKIRGRTWDAVVLQDQSLRPVHEPAAMLEPARTLGDAARKQGARVVFYLTWARQKTPETQPKINAAYRNVAEKLAAEVAPVGIAWERALKAAPETPLHAADGSHPNPQGSYLAACVFYGVLFGESPVGLPAKLTRGDRVLIDLPKDRAEQLQKHAWEAIEGR